MQTFETLAVTVENHIAHVQLNRPEKANAMNLPMWGELQTCFEALSDEPDVRVIVLSGAGKNFCAGIDLDMFASIAGDAKQEPARAAEQLRQTILRLQGNLTAIEKCRKPVLAAIHGNCVGGGIDMVSCCDMRYCADDAVFSIKEIDIGMTADVGTLQRLPHIIPQGVVRELAYTGRDVEAGEAYEIGLVNQVYESREALLEGVMAIAADIASKSPLAIRGTKEMLVYTRDHSVADGLNYIATWNASMLSQADVMAALTARMEKKVAKFDS
ncbi:enoyl-CoA hydratase [Litorivivens lipolytica]|uniref:Enoyl-CoA hydratase n=1 Tax=Litorivivens lipolytica TaxID=1524264 RepID=A0A7W4W3A8_9GAMM|nr:crotonase/enoyl-CoA hydratase family protein [Litorivivens lipolytica]MBB3046675.1 enoyl-CoA hydratase [Litorivivens lipolytica]